MYWSNKNLPPLVGESISRSRYEQTAVIEEIMYFLISILQVVPVSMEHLVNFSEIREQRCNRSSVGNSPIDFTVGSHTLISDRSHKSIKFCTISLYRSSSFSPFGMFLLLNSLIFWQNIFDTFENTNNLIIHVHSTFMQHYVHKCRTSILCVRK